MKCPEADRTLQLIRRRDADELSAAEQGLLNRHLAGCAGCSEEAIRLDPTLLFSALSASAEGEGREPGRSRASSGGTRRGAHRPVVEAGSARETDLLVAGVLAAVDVESSRRRLSSSRRPILVAASLALVGVGLVGLVVARGRLGKEDPAVPAEAASSARPAERAARFAARPLIEDLNHPGARVYEFSAVSPKEPRVVFIANPDADI